MASDIIVNADDFGISHSVNEAIKDCFLTGMVTRTTIMVNMPYFKEAVEMALEYSFFDKIGLHLNLMEGPALTEEIKAYDFICSDGYFNGRLQFYLRSHFIVSLKVRKAIQKEMEAQIKKFIEAGFPLKHIDSHFHIHNELFIYSILKPLAKKYNMNSMRLLRNLMCVDSLKSWIKYSYKLLLNLDIKTSFEHSSYFGSYDDFRQCCASKKGKVEIMVHPNYIDNELVDIVGNTYIPLTIYKY